MVTSPQFGLTLPNRSVLIGSQTMEELISLGVEAEESGLFQTLWVGDSILAKPRPESVVVLAALASRTRRVRLGVGCMASFPIRNPVLLAAQWATLDLVAGPGRLLLVACQGGRLASGKWEMEEKVFGIPQGQRVRRMVEGIEAMRVLWTEESATYQGKYVQFTDVSLEPKPVTKPCPVIWMVANPRPGADDPDTVNRATRRVARVADGWMTTLVSPGHFATRWRDMLEARKQEGRDAAAFDNCLYYNANINEDREAAFRESKRYLDAYYTRDWPREVVDRWVAYGSPREVIEKIRGYAEAGAKELTIRLTSYDQRGQFKRLIEEVLPAFR